MLSALYFTLRTVLPSRQAARRHAADTSCCRTHAPQGHTSATLRCDAPHPFYRPRRRTASQALRALHAQPQGFRDTRPCCVRYNSYLRRLGLEEVDWREIGARWRRTGRTHPVLGDEASEQSVGWLVIISRLNDQNAGDEDTSTSKARQTLQWLNVFTG